VDAATVVGVTVVVTGFVIAVAGSLTVLVLEHAGAATAITAQIAHRGDGLIVSSSMSFPTGRGRL
jgi:hypothetical protein